MKMQMLDAAIFEAERFLKKAKRCKHSPTKTEYGYAYWDTKETAATRRSSMDLTRALSDLRQGR